MEMVKFNLLYYEFIQSLQMLNWF